MAGQNAKDDPKQERLQMSFWDFCLVSNDSLFAGVQFDKSKDGKPATPRFCFPRGYQKPSERSSATEAELKADFFRLLHIIEDVKANYGDKLPEEEKAPFDFPIRACLAVLQYWLDFGYFMETETIYKKGLFGKINWPKTIKRVKPQVVKGADGRYSVIYLDLISRLSRHKEDCLITLIHKYCVHYAAKTVGPLLSVSESELDSPELDFDYAVFSETLNEKMSTTFNDRFLELFQAMKEIVEYLKEKSTESGESADELHYGLKSFAYAWEYMVDRIFKTAEASDYNPHLKFVATDAKDQNGESFGDEDEKRSEAAEETHRSTLRPDTIMVGDNGDCFVLDSKYYKYGLTGNKTDLPGGDSVPKQMAYAEYVEKKKSVAAEHIYNAFILPFCAAAENGILPGNDENLCSFVARRVGYIYGDWKDKSRPSHKIVCILLDMKSVMRYYASSKDARKALAQMIREGAK